MFNIVKSTTLTSIFYLSLNTRGNLAEDPSEILLLVNYIMF